MLTNKVYSWTILMFLIVTLSFLGCEKESPTGTENLTEADASNEITALAIHPNIPAFDLTERFAMDMNDRFSGSGASGDARLKMKHGEMNLRTRGRGLETNHSFEVHVTVGFEGETGFNPETIHVFPVTSNSRGKLRLTIEDFDLGLDPGSYRLDFLVVHDHTPPDPPSKFYIGLPASTFCDY